MQKNYYSCVKYQVCVVKCEEWHGIVPCRENFKCVILKVYVVFQNREKLLLVTIFRKYRLKKKNFRQFFIGSGKNSESWS
jgi:hypothetical protein